MDEQQLMMMAEQGEPSIMGVVIGLLFYLAIGALITWFVYSPLARVPAEHQKFPPAAVWLMLVPLVNIVILWIVVPFKLPDSLRSYFEAQNTTPDQTGDYGKKLGLTWAIAATISILPIIGILAGLVALVVMILYLAKVNGYKQSIG